MQRHTFVTGVSSGIGLALAKACLSRGDRVYGLSRRTPETLIDNPEFTFQAVDVTDFDNIAGNLKSLLGAAPRLDLVVLNAGVLGNMRDLKETPMHEIQPVMDVNVWSNKFIIDGLADLNKEIRQIIGLSSGAAVSGNRGWNAYSISKATFLMMLKLYAQEMPNTHFCSFAPGLVDTAMQDVLCALPDTVTDRFTTLKRIQAARGTDSMPTPDAVAPALLAGFEKVLSEPSGSFVDIRQMD